MAGLETLSMIAGLVGSGLSAVGTIAAGNQAAAAAEFEAKQLEAAAAEERAASQREAADKRKERDFILSRQQAVAAGSNLGALDETVLDLAGDVVQEGAYQEGMIRYGGEQREIGRRAQATGRRMTGQAEKSGSMFAAAGTIMKGIGTFASDWSANRSPSTAYAGRYR